MRFLFSGWFCDEKRFDDVVKDGRIEAMGIGGSAGLGGVGRRERERWGEKGGEGDKVDKGELLQVRLSSSSIRAIN